MPEPESGTSQRLVYINGKFLAQRITGVQRFGRELLNAMDRLLPTGRRIGRPVLLVPAGTPVAQMANIDVVELPGTRNLHLWEQTLLPWRARCGLLLNIGGTAPLLHRHQIATIHDAAIFDHPEAYTARFRRWYRFAFRTLSRTACTILVSSRYSMKRFEAIFGSDAPFTWVGAGVDHIGRMGEDLSILKRLVLETEPYLLAVGSANPTKNFARLLEAFNRAQSREKMRLVIVGGVNESVFSEVGSLSGLSYHVIVAGPVSDEELKTLYQHAQAFIFPSIYEGFGFPALEAMACGSPVIAARAASIPEVGGDAPLYFDPFDESAIARAIDDVAESPELREQLRQKGWARAGEYRWDDVASRVLVQLERFI